MLPRPMVMGLLPNDAALYSCCKRAVQGKVQSPPVEAVEPKVMTVAWAGVTAANALIKKPATTDLYIWYTLLLSKTTAAAGNYSAYCDIFITIKRISGPPKAL